MNYETFTYSGNCPHCQGLMQKEIEDCLQKEGWYIHGHYPDEKCPNQVHVATFGFPQKFKHLNIQICFPLTNREMLRLFTGVMQAVRKGNKFVSGKEYYGLIEEDFVFRFINSKYNGEDFLRLLIPTENDDFEGDYYRAQFSKLNNQ